MSDVQQMWDKLPMDAKWAVRNVLSAVSELDAGWTGDVLAIAGRLHCARLKEKKPMEVAGGRGPADNAGVEIPPPRSAPLNGAEQ